MAGEEIALTGMIQMLMAFAVFILLIVVGIYIYLSFAFMAVGKKAKDPTPGLAWIPGIGPRLIAFRASKMHWWPWLLLITIFIPIISFLGILTFAVMSIIWEWKMFEKINKPGWWAILRIIPILNLIIIGVAGWSKK